MEGSNADKECRSDLKPYVGKLFESVEDDVSFYEEYANLCRFDTRRFGHKLSNRVKTWQTLVCSRQGKLLCDEENESTMPEGSANKRRRRSSRCLCNARLTLKYVIIAGSTRYVISNFIENHNHEMVDKKHVRYMKSNRKLGGYPL
ncbi:protein FAR1-RELATED SEQUENCE 11-like [Salvia hispanica]|uniref:protein FAR1-RELATED SEQUENCE 11-like n=1 Tax=Salvia hispanica TaxID=49212 RepID=UPI002009D4EA|nr:protein FAR1-RELATED SEQUENCE 11-like [Salvia hispanica]